MTEHLLTVGLSLALILACCAAFVNAVERFATMLGLHQGVTGSVLAAISTALPETIVPILAIAFSKGPDAHAIGIGAIAGAPFMLATLGFFVTGASALVYHKMGKRPAKMSADISCLTRDMVFFLLFYGIAVATTFVREHTIIKGIVAVGLLGSYAIYVKQTVCCPAEGIGEIDVLYMTKFLKLKPTLTCVVVQMLASLVLLIVGAHEFIIGVQGLSHALGVSPMILSLIITPVATELPEKFNTIIWIGKKKDTMALGNMTGAMVFQSCFPVVFGMLFTEWHLHGITMISACIALFSASVVLVWTRITKTISPWLLTGGGLLYLIFLACVFLKGGSN